MHVSLSMSELHEHAYSHCSLLWCENGIVYQSIGVIPYLFTKFHTSKHLGKRVTQTCMFTCSLLCCEKGIVYQQVINVGVVSLIPTCLQSFIHPSM